MNRAFWFTFIIIIITFIIIIIIIDCLYIYIWRWILHNIEGKKKDSQRLYEKEEAKKKTLEYKNKFVTSVAFRKQGNRSLNRNIPSPGSCIRNACSTFLGRSLPGCRKTS